MKPITYVKVAWQHKRKKLLILQIYYELVNKTDKFSVSSNGIVTVLKPFDYEKDKRKHIVCFVL